VTASSRCGFKFSPIRPSILRKSIGDSLKQDFKYVARQLRRGPGFAAAVIVTLAVGIGFGARVANVPLGVALMAGAFGAPLLGHWLKSLAFGISRF
jgi:hypothetical protein